MEPQIVITANADGSVRLQANIDNAIALYGMLERAKDAIRAGIDQQTKRPGLVAATADALKQLDAAGI